MKCKGQLLNSFIFSIVIVGMASFLMVWMPFIVKKTRISYSVFYLIGGFLLYNLFPQYLPNPLPRNNESAIRHLSELIVIISLMGAGLKIDRRISIKNWILPIRLVLLAMLLCMIAASLYGYFLLGFSLAAAVLLGSVLAPTDPVLAADVQVGPPKEEGNSIAKFTLTSEAGINDGLAFPFTWLAVTLALIAEGKDTSLLYWFSFHMIYQISAGVVIGIVFGKIVGYLVFNFSQKRQMTHLLDGFLAIAMTLLVYGITELLHGYGFIAVFVCAITFRQHEKGHDYHKTMHAFTDQCEKLLVGVFLILFGGAIAMGIFSYLSWQMFLYALTFLLLIRPVAAYLSLVGTNLSIKEKIAISFFGIKGVGSVFYLAFAFNEAVFGFEEQIWSLVTLTVALSILMHGLTANNAMRYLSNTKA